MTDPTGDPTMAFLYIRGLLAWLALLAPIFFIRGLNVAFVVHESQVTNEHAPVMVDFGRVRDRVYSQMAAKHDCAVEMFDCLASERIRRVDRVCIGGLGGGVHDFFLGEAGLFGLRRGIGSRAEAD